MSSIPSLPPECPDIFATFDLMSRCGKTLEERSDHRRRTSVAENAR
jgi:hypothetical protein